MVSAFAALNGSGNQQVYVSAVFVRSDQARNRSEFRGEVRYYGNGWGSWDSSSTFYWGANFGGVQVSGTWNIPYARRNDTYTVLWAGTFTVAHNAEGFASAVGIAASIDTNHTSIGDGTASVAHPAPPRIPKPPTAARNLRVTRADPTALTIAWDAPADVKGAPIIDYRVRLHTRSPADSAGYTDRVVSAAVRSVTLPNLRPATTYYVLVYARNAAGTTKSNQLAPRTNSGAYLRSGDKWVGVEVLVYTPNGWESAEVLTYTESGWRQTL